MTLRNHTHSPLLMHPSAHHPAAPASSNRENIPPVNPYLLPVLDHCNFLYPAPAPPPFPQQIQAPVLVVGGQHHYYAAPGTYGAPYVLPDGCPYFPGLYPPAPAPAPAPWGHINPMAPPPGPVLGPVALPPRESAFSPTQVQETTQGPTEGGLMQPTGGRPVNGKRYPNLQVSEGGKDSHCIHGTWC